MDGWIDIVEFATKYGVSQSTLRRRIRSSTIAYKMERGKYLLEDSAEALRQAPLFSRRVRQTAPRQNMKTQLGTSSADHGSNSNDLQELERIQQENRKLRSHIAELETLVKVLEAEVQPARA